MIYIYDDRNTRRNDNAERLKNFSDIVVFKTIYLIPGKQVEEIITESIENPECIIFHKSYAFEDNNVSFETVRDWFTDLGIPVVIFSGGTEGCSNGNSIININADLMYNNLPLFLEDFRSNGKMNIDVLLWGERHLLNAMLQFQSKFAIEYFIENSLDDNIDNIVGIKRTITQRCHNLKSFGESLISEIDKYSQISWGELANIIDSNIKKSI